VARSKGGMVCYHVYIRVHGVKGEKYKVLHTINHGEEFSRQIICSPTICNNDHHRRSSKEVVIGEVS
jgi:hypothetical protein